MLHYGIIILVIVVIIWLQILFFLQNRKKQNELKSIFSLDCNNDIMIAEKNGISVIMSVAEIAVEKENELTCIEKELQKLDKEHAQRNERIRSLSNCYLHSDPDIQAKITTIEAEIEKTKAKKGQLIERREQQIDSLASIGNAPAEMTSSIFNKIISSINNYLTENKGAASDFHLIKDVVDRNCDSVEEEIATLTPIPLYLGLIGTMVGILVGVGFLVFSGGIEALLSTQMKEASSGSSGIIELLGGVALAMSSSIAGILLTTAGSYFTKEAKNELNSNKNSFLSWIQVKLLPTLSGNATSAIYTLQQNLSNFNHTFASNVEKMGGAFTMANQAHHDQLKLMQLVEKMDITRMAKANVEVLKELQNNTQEFGKFNHYLHSVTSYLDKVQALSGEINEHLNRTKAIEDMGVFFKDEITQIEERKGAISRSVGRVDVTLQSALNKLQESAEDQLKEFIKLSVTQHEKFSRTIEEQQHTLSTTVSEQQNQFTQTIEEQKRMLQQKMEETSLLVEELKNLSSIKTSMSGMERAAAEQNQKITELTLSIEKFAQVRGNTSTDTHTSMPAVTIPEIPIWMKVSVISGVCTVVVASLIYIIPQLIHYIGLLIN